MSVQASAHELGSGAQQFTSDELAALKRVAQMRPRWWRSSSTVSALAFVLSLLTSAVSIYTGYRKDINDQLALLSTSLQSIQELNLRQVEIHEKYKNTPYEGQAASLVTAQINNTLRTASDLAFKLGANASTAALTTVARGLYGLGDIDGAQKLSDYGLAAARSANDESVALRQLAFLKIRHGGSEAAVKEGEDLFLRASNLETKYTNLSAEGILWIKAATQAEWGTSLAAINCVEAQKHMNEAIQLLKSPMSNLDLEQLRGNLRMQLANGIGGVRTCQPLSPM
jgi:hypothetical protein